MAARLLIAQPKGHVVAAANMSLSLLGISVLCACDRKIDIAEWNEEVRLSNGAMVFVQRRASAYSGGLPNSTRGRTVELVLTYEPLDLQWRAKISPTFVRDPVTFDIIDGPPYLVLFVGDREYCRGRAETDYTAQFLRWTNGEWVDVPQAQFPVDRVTMNLSGDYWGRTAQDGYKGLVRWDQKRLRGGATHKAPDTVKLYFERGNRTCAASLKN